MPVRPPLRVIEGGGGATPRMGPALELAALGMGLTLTVTLLARLPAWHLNLGVFQGLYALAFAFYAMALIGLRRYARIPRAGLAVFAVALATRAALVATSPSLSGDLYRYVWEGRVITAGENPYRHAPLDPALAPLRDREIHPHINHPELSAIYPPLAEAGFALVAWLSPSVPAFKLWVVVHDLVLVLLLLVWARRRGESAVPVIAYAWNPLMLVEYAGSGHNDPTALVWLALALMLAERRPVLSALALSTGALVKLAPLVALPFLLRRWTWRARLMCAAVLGSGLVWYASQTRSAYSGLVAYWGTWRNNELAFHYLERWTGHFTTARAVALLALALALAFAWWKNWEAERAARLGFRAGYLLTPVAHPWYLGWILMFEPLRPSPPWLLLSLTAILNYGVLATPSEGRDFHVPLAWRWVEYGLPAMLGLALLARHRLRRRHRKELA